MGMIRERLNETLGVTETNAMLGRPKPRREASTMPEGEKFVEALRGEPTSSTIPTGERFSESLRKP